MLLLAAFLTQVSLYQFTVGVEAMVENLHGEGFRVETVTFEPIRCTLYRPDGLNPPQALLTMPRESTDIKLVCRHGPNVVSIDDVMRTSFGAERTLVHSDFFLCDEETIIRQLPFAMNANQLVQLINTVSDLSHLRPEHITYSYPKILPDSYPFTFPQTIQLDGEKFLETADHEVVFKNVPEAVTVKLHLERKVLLDE